jgi:hypothetical protein
LGVDGFNLDSAKAFQFLDRSARHVSSHSREEVIWAGSQTMCMEPEFGFEVEICGEHGGDRLRSSSASRWA